MATSRCSPIVIDLTGDDETDEPVPRIHINKKRKRPSPVDTSYQETSQSNVNDQKTPKAREANRPALSAEQHLPTPPLTALWNPIPTLSTRKHPQAFDDAAALIKVLPLAKIELAEKARSGNHPADRVAAALLAAKTQIIEQQDVISRLQEEKQSLKKDIASSERDLDSWKKDSLALAKKFHQLEIQIRDFLGQGIRTKPPLQMISLAKRKMVEIDELMADARDMEIHRINIDKTLPNQSKKYEPLICTSMNLFPLKARLAKALEQFTNEHLKERKRHNHTGDTTEDDSGIGSEIESLDPNDGSQEDVNKTGDTIEDDFDLSSESNYFTSDNDDSGDDEFDRTREKTSSRKDVERVQNETISMEVIRAAQIGTRYRGPIQGKKQRF